MKHNELHCHFITTFVYVKYKDQLRTPLWDKMLHQATVHNKPWCSVGDFNAITTFDKKFGGVPYHMRNNIEFIAFIEAGILTDIGISGHKFTWSNKRGINRRI